jgi:lipoprotein signal peptidase
MFRCALALGGTTPAFAAADLTHKAAGGAENVHPRSAAYVAVVLGLSLVWAGAIVMTRSVAMAVGGGVLAGGAFGNLVSLGLWPGVPNPIATASFAFNLADVFVFVGFVAVSVVALRLARIERDRLNQPLRLR